jgi:hypothetical protein
MRKLFFLSWLTLCACTSLNAQYQFNWNERSQLLYESITSLKIPEARKAILIESKSSPNNLVFPLLESYADFYQLFFNENESDYNLLYPRFNTRIRQLEMGPQNSPYYLYSLGLSHLHKALVAIRFDKNWEAALDFRKAYLLFKENKAKYPHFTPNDVYYGLLTSVIGTIPKGYQWMVNLLGMKGKISEGNALVLKYINSNDEYSKQVRNEALFLYPYMVMLFEGNPEKAFKFIESTPYNLKANQMHAYMAANLYLNHQQSNKALNIVQQMDNNETYLQLPFWQLELGYAYLNELKLDKAEKCLLEFVNSFKGKFYVKDAYERLSWIAFMRNEMNKANVYRNKVLNTGNEITDADKQAYQNAKAGNWPNALLLKARLLSDGGYQVQALNILAGKTSNDFSTDRDKTEFAYRLARIYDLMDQTDQAIRFYNSAIEKGTDLTDYFAARAALQIGLIYEKRGLYTKAIVYFNTCLEMKNHAFKNSLDQKAKSGIQRCLKQ